MNFINPYVEIWEQNFNNIISDMYSHIARCTRVCYQSEKKDNNETEEEFVKRVILRKTPWNSEANHLGVLEHGTIYLKDEFIGNPNDKSELDKYKNNKYSRYYKFAKVLPNRCCTYVTTNLRVLIENNWLEDIIYICSPTEYHARRVTVSFITNIGVTREFNRHRVNSPSEESTRYCNYNKRNDGQIKIGLPAWLLDEALLPYIESHQFDKLSSYCEDVLANDNLIDNWCDIDYYLFALTVSEFCYNALITKNWKPQQAREVLPLATKSQLIHTAFIDDWKHFFALRSDNISGPTHPNANYIAKDLYNKFRNAGYIN